MVTIVYGKSGTGKSDWIFAEAERAAETERVFLLVPDREAVSAESRAASLRFAGNIDVLTFGRLCNTLFRTYGGLCTDYIGKGAKKLMMRNVMCAMGPLLKEYGKDPKGLGIYEKLSSMRTVFYQDKIFPAELETAAAALGHETPLGAKLSDLALIFSAFDAEVSSRWEDPDGMLSHAVSLLAMHDFFEGCTVLIDSFTSFSPQQADILEHIFRGAKNVAVTLPYLPEEREEAAVHFLAGTDDRLRRTARRAGVSGIRTVTLREATRYRSAELAALSRSIWSQDAGAGVHTAVPQDITLVRAANIFAEAEAAALDICRAIRAGLRYRDIAVIVRDPKSYEGILDAVFRKYEIPYFMSSRKEIAEKPFVKLIFSAFSIIDRGFRGQDVITYLKTGLTGLTPDEVSLFENYIIKWNLRGKLFTGDEPWNMHPHGYGYAFTDEDHGVLTTLADLRARVIAPLKTFSAAFRNARTVRERAELLFDFLAGLSVSETLQAQANDAWARGECAWAQESIQLWNVFCETLDQLVICVGDSEASAQEFSQMLMMLFLETDIGKIPTSVDEVVISGAAQTLSGGYRYVYLLGASEGSFPQRVGEDGIFSEYEKATLAPLGVELSDRLERRVSEELYYFCRAAAVPSDRLYVSYAHYSLSGAEQRESLGVKRIRKLFPALCVTDHELCDKAMLIERRAASFEHATMMGGALGKALHEYYEGREEYAEKLRNMKIPLGAEKTALSPENAELLFPGKLSTSYTRLEKFIKCRFAYFCEYELRLRDDSPANFGAVDIGSFMHGVLEKTVQWIAKGGEGEISESVRAIAGEYLGEIFHRDVENLPKRLQHLFHYLCRSAEIFAKRMKEEFDACQFRPLDFELSVGREGNAVTPMRLSGEDVTVELRGKIDRVDAYEGEGGKLYIRVVDYKTGDKTFDLENISLGLDMQMLLYLFSIWENGEKRYGKEIVPAGVLYAGIKPPQIDAAVGDSTEESAVSIKTSGLFLKDEAVLRAMDPELKGKWIPVKATDLKKDDAKKPKLMGLDAFMTLKSEVRDTVLKYAAELKAGKANAEPLRAGGKSPCEYCRMRAVCRIRK